VRSDGADQRRIDSRQLFPRCNGAGGKLDEIEHLTYRQPEAAPPDIEHQDGALVARSGRPAEQCMPVRYRQQPAANVNQALHGKWHAGNPGSGEAREDFSNPTGRRGTNQVADSKNHRRQRLGFTHVY